MTIAPRLLKFQYKPWKNKMTNSIAMSSHIDVIIVTGRNITISFCLSLYAPCTFPSTFGKIARERAAITYAPFLSIQAIYHWKNCNAEKCPERNFQRFQSGEPYWNATIENDRLFLFSFFCKIKGLASFFRGQDLNQNCDNNWFNTNIYIVSMIRSRITKFGGSLIQSTLVKLSLYSMKCGETWFANRLLMLNLLRQLCKLVTEISVRSHLFEF